MHRGLRAPAGARNRKIHPLLLKNISNGGVLSTRQAKQGVTPIFQTSFCFFKVDKLVILRN